MGFNRKRILLVDDNKTTVMYIALLLKRMGFDVIPAENGMEALRMLQLSECDLVLLDMAMPVLDGLETLKRIRTEYGMQRLPVVVVTVDTNQQSVDACIKLGCSGVLAKPVQLDELHDILQDCIFTPMGRRREHIRSAYTEKVRVACDGAVSEFHGDTLSEGGIYVRTISPFPVGTDMVLTIPVDAQGSVEVKGTVIYTKDRYGDLAKTPLGMAVEFHSLSDSDTTRLKNCLDRLLTGDIVSGQEEPVVATEIHTVPAEE
ncbi:MAG: response regulator [bacterium]|nr:response regulator [bacterium]